MKEITEASASVRLLLATAVYYSYQFLFLGSYALQTDPIVRGNLVSVSVCHYEDEKTRDTKTSGR